MQFDDMIFYDLCEIFHFEVFYKDNICDCIEIYFDKKKNEENLWKKYLIKILINTSIFLKYNW